MFDCLDPDCGLDWGVLPEMPCLPEPLWPYVCQVIFGTDLDLLGLHWTDKIGWLSAENLDALHELVDTIGEHLERFQLLTLARASGRHDQTYN